MAVSLTPSRAASTHAPGFACGAPHVKLLNSVVEPCVKFCLWITGAHIYVFLQLQCIQYGLDILTFYAEMNLDIQSGAFDKSHAKLGHSCSSQMSSATFTAAKHTEQVLLLYCSPSSTLHMVLKQLWKPFDKPQMTWKLRRNEEPNTYLLTKKPQQCHHWTPNEVQNKMWPFRSVATEHGQANLRTFPACYLLWPLLDTFSSLKDLHGLGTCSLGSSSSNRYNYCTPFFFPTSICRTITEKQISVHIITDDIKVKTWRFSFLLGTTKQRCSSDERK